MGPHKFRIISKLILREALRVFEQNNWDRGTETNSKYELLIKYVITHFFPPKAIQRQKRYIQKGLYKPRETKICEFIFRIAEILEYLKKLPSFGISQGLSDDDILNLVSLSFPSERQK